jgi:hypothetical protein
VTILWLGQSFGEPAHTGARSVECAAILEREQDHEAQYEHRKSRCDLLGLDQPVSFAVAALRAD